MFEALFYKIGIGLIALASWLGVVQAQPPVVDPLGAALPSAAALFETSLQSAITSDATSMTLTANAPRGGGALSGYNCFTIDEGSAQAEFVCGTVSGTAVSSMTRGISPLTGTTTDTDVQFAHRRGANVKITNFPLIQILKAQANGEDTFPNLLTYATSPCSVGSPNTAICSKAYVDGVAVAGASDANETTKGIGELATQTEAEDGASLGSTGARLVLPASIATSSPTGTGSKVVVSRSADGKIHPNFIATSSNDKYVWGGNSTSTGLVTHTATSTFATTTMASSTVTYALNVGATSTANVFVGTGASATSSLAGNLQVSGNATTSTLTVSNACVGCPLTYTGSSTSYSVSASTVTYTGSIPTWANTALIKYVITTDSAVSVNGQIILTRVGLTSQDIVSNVGFGTSGTNTGNYTWSWSGSDFAVQETADANTNSSVAGTAYWYK